MVNKRGFMRIVEATIAILLILGAFLLLNMRKNQEVKEDDLINSFKPYLDEVARNSSLRNSIVSEYDLTKPFNEQNNKKVTQDIEDFLRTRINNPSINFSIRICRLEEVCFLQPYPEADEIYGTERIVTANLNVIYEEPKKMKMFIWRIKK